MKDIFTKILLDSNIDVKQIHKMSSDELDTFKLHPLFKELNLTENEIEANVIYLQSIIDQNTKCSLEKKCPFDNKHLFAIRLENKMLSFYDGICPKHREEVLANEYKKRILYNYYQNSKDKDIKFDAKFNEIHKQMGLNASKRQFISIGRKILDTPDESRTSTGIYLSGKPGVGKTYLSIALANTTAIAYKKTVAIVYLPEFVELSKPKTNNYGNDSSFDELIETIKNVDFVIFDDIGAEHASEWFYSNCWLNILNYRCSSRKLTFFNSNLTIKQYERKILSKIKTSDAWMTAERITQRINDIVCKNYIHIKAK